MLYELIKFHNKLRQWGTTSDWIFGYFLIWVGSTFVVGIIAALVTWAYPQSMRLSSLILWVANGSYVVVVVALNFMWRKWYGSLWYDEQRQKELEEAIAWRQKALTKLQAEIEEKRLKEYQRTQMEMAKLAEGLGKTKPVSVSDPDFS